MARHGSRQVGAGHGWKAAAAVAMLAGIATAAPPGAGGAASRSTLTASRAAGALTSLTLTSVDPDGEPAAGPSTEAAVAANGRYTAFVSPAGTTSGPVSAVYLRENVNGTTTLVSNPADGDASAPDISADGGLVSYGQDGQVLVAAHRASGLDVQQATGNPGDPRYAHVVPCPAALGPGRVTPCGPRLSADGSTLVYPAELTPVPPELSVDVIVRNGKHGDSEKPLTGDMLDFTPYSPGSPNQFASPGGSATVSYTNEAVSPVPFTGATITEPPGFPAGNPFKLDQTTCTGTLRSGSSCAAMVSFDEGACPSSSTSTQLITGSLVTSSPVPGGQSVIELTAVCQVRLSAELRPTGPAGPVTTAYRAMRYRVMATAAAQPDCPVPPTGLPLTAAPAINASAVHDAPLSDAGGAEAGRPYVVWMPLSIQPMLKDATARVSFVAANGNDCGIQLVNNPQGLKLADPLPSSAPAPCFQDEQLSVTSPPPSPSVSPSPPASPSPSPSVSSPPSASSLPPSASPSPTASRSHSPSATPSTSQPLAVSVKRRAAGRLLAAASPSSCTAYLLINPAPVQADAAFLGWTYISAEGTGLNLASYITVQGVRHVILARHDPGTTGDFATSPATVVSVAGAELPGAAEPSVSADGRYVGFAAPVPDGTPGQQPAAGASEVWLDDTGWSAGHTVRSGSTTLVSCLPRPDPGPCLAAPDADSPSLSGSGQQVAFATTAAVVPANGYQAAPAGADRGASTGQPSPDQVYIRSVGTQATVLVSVQSSGVNAGHGGDGPSYAPVITQDSTAVAFVSRAAGLTSAPLAAGAANLYLGTDPNPGTRTSTSTSTSTSTEIVSASGAGFPSGTLVGMPSVDAIGRLATFPATAALLPGAPAGGTSVYTFTRIPRLLASPADTAFGQILLGSGTRHGDLTVTDTGPGPGTVTVVAVTGPFQVSSDGCTGALLLTGDQCTVTVTFTPSAVGPAAGEVTVATEDDGGPPVSVTVPATADVPAPQLAISPDVATYGEAVQVTGTAFPPARSITLTWSTGLGSAAAIASESGSLSATMVIFPDDVTGPRTLLASSAGRVLAIAPFLAQRAPEEPPFSRGSPP